MTVHYHQTGGVKTKHHLILVMLIFSVPLAVAVQDPIYFAYYNDVTNIESIMKYDQSGLTTVYTEPSQQYHIGNIAVDSQNNYYAMVSEDRYPQPSPGYIIKNGQRIRSVTDGSWVYVDQHDRLYYSVQTGLWPDKEELFRIDPDGTTLVYETPRDALVITGIAMDSRDNLYVMTNFGDNREPDHSFFTKNDRILFRAPGLCDKGTAMAVDKSDHVYYACSGVEYGQNLAEVVYEYNPILGVAHPIRVYQGNPWPTVSVSGPAIDDEGNIFAILTDEQYPNSQSQILRNWSPIVQLPSGGSGGGPAIRKKVPVVLVHGIYSDDTIWDQLAPLLSNPPNNFQVYRVGQLLGQPGLVPNNGDIRLLAMRDLEQAINSLNASKVDIVAHSMGGLVSRHYIDVKRMLGGTNKIRKLIMLGTPNEGAPIATQTIAWLIGRVQGQDPSDTARYQMDPRSPFLRNLNSNFDSYGTELIGIAGTFLNPIVLLWPTFQYSYAWLGRDYPTDSIVPRWSVNIPGMACYQRSLAHMELLGPTYYFDATTMYTIVGLLKGNAPSPSVFPECPANSQDGISPGTNTQTRIFSGMINPNEVLQVYQDSLGEQFAAALNWTTAQGNLSLGFVSPSGQAINISNYNTINNITYFSGAFREMSLESFSFTEPEQGNWTVQVYGSAIQQSAAYTMIILMKKDVLMETTFNHEVYRPREPVIINVRLTNNSMPMLNATVQGRITKPDNTQEVIELFDDGNHNDRMPQDGVYGNSFTSALQEGMYVLYVTAAQPHVFEISDTQTFFVEDPIDLEITTADIEITPTHVSLGQNITMHVTAHVRNSGTKDASNASIEFYTDEPQQVPPFATREVTVPANASVQVEAEFNHTYSPDVPWLLMGTPVINSTINISLGDRKLRPYHIHVVARELGDNNLANNVAARYVNATEPIYILAVSVTNYVGIPLGDGRFFPLDPDILFLLSLQVPASLGIRGNIGVLNQYGEGKVIWSIPAIPELAGRTVYAAFITIDASLQQPFLSFSDAIPVTFQN